jgi:hypothetical protein
MSDGSESPAAHAPAPGSEQASNAEVMPADQAAADQEAPEDRPQSRATGEPNGVSALAGHERDGERSAPES